AGMLGPGSHRMMLDRSVELLRQGIPVTPQVACRPLNFDFDLAEPFIFESLPVFKPISAADLDGKRRIYADPSFRAELRETLEGGAGPFRASYRRIWVSLCPAHPELEERPLEEVARERGVHPVDLMLDLSLESRFKARFRMAVVNFDETEVAELPTSPDTVFALSDSPAHA